MGENLRNVELSRKIFARICRIVKIHHVILMFIAFLRCPMQLEDIIPIADGRKKLFTTKLINTLSNKRYSNFCIDLLTSSINSSKKRKMKRITFFFYQTRKTPKWREHCRGNVRRRPSTSPEHLPNSIVRLSSKRILDIWSHEMDCTETYSNDTK